MTTDEEMKTFAQLNRKIWEQKQTVEQINKTLAEEGKALDLLKQDYLKYMELFDLQKMHTPGWGTISKKLHSSVKVPKDEQKDLFFQQLKNDGYFDALVTVNSMTLNAWYKEKEEQALQEGDIDFSYPGLETKPYTTISFRKD